MNYWTVCPTSRFEIVIEGNFIFSEREVLTAYIIKKYNIGCQVTSISFPFLLLFSEWYPLEVTVVLLL